MGKTRKPWRAGPCWRIRWPESENRKENNLKNYSATLVHIYIYIYIYMLYIYVIYICFIYICYIYMLYIYICYIYMCYIYIYVLYIYVIYIYIKCESGIAYPIMFQWLMLRINVPVRRRHTGSCFRIADLFSSAAVGLEPKRPVRIAPLVLDHRVFSCDIILDP